MIAFTFYLLLVASLRSVAFRPSFMFQRKPAISKVLYPSAIFSTIEPQDRGLSERRLNDGAADDLETARSMLEDLMEMQQSVIDEDPSRLLMTSAGRYRRQLEIDLLRQLYDYGGKANPTSDTAVDELMHLWMYEHDAESAGQLEAMQHSCSPGMAREEQQLRTMAEKYPTWAEPRARLAILLFMKGISDEAYVMAIEALQLKPWHFEIHPILIMICLRREDVGQALYWARQQLPNRRPSEGNRRRRNEWVDRALDQAVKQWEEAERETHERHLLANGMAFGENGCSLSDEDNCDTWQ